MSYLSTFIPLSLSLLTIVLLTIILCCWLKGIDDRTQRIANDVAEMKSQVNAWWEHMAHDDQEQ